MVSYDGQLWWSVVMVSYGAVVMVSCDGQLSWSIVMDSYDGQLWWSVMMVRYDGQLWWSVMMVRYDGQLRWSVMIVVMVNYDGQLWSVMMGPTAHGDVCWSKVRWICLQSWKCLYHFSFHRWQNNSHSSIAATCVSCAPGHASAASRMETHPKVTKVHMTC